MSLEEALAANTAALNANTEALLAANAGREAAIAAAATLTGGSEGTGRRGRPPGSATKDKAEDKKETKTEEKKPSGPPSVDDLRKVAGDFMGVEDADERETRKTFVKGLLEHLGATKVVDIDEKDRAQAIAWIEAKGRGEEVSFGGEEDGGEDDMLG